MKILDGNLGLFLSNLIQLMYIVCMTRIVFLLTCLYIQQYKTIEQKLNHKCLMIHYQGVNTSIIFLIFSSISTTKSFMRSLSCCYTCQHYPVGVEIEIFYTRFSNVFKSWSALFFCNYCTIAFYFLCCIALTLLICGDVKLNAGPKNAKFSLFFTLPLESKQPYCSRCF